MKRNRLISAVCVLSLALSLCAGGCSEKKEEATSDIKTETQKVKKAEKEDINSVHLRDKDTLYADDDETSVVTMSPGEMLQRIQIIPGVRSIAIQ